MAKEELIQFEGLVTEILPTRDIACNSTPTRDRAYTAGKMRRTGSRRWRAIG